jgi:hypothetical protein
VSYLFVYNLFRREGPVSGDLVNIREQWWLKGAVVAHQGAVVAHKGAVVAH